MSTSLVAKIKLKKDLRPHAFIQMSGKRKGSGNKPETGISRPKGRTSWRIQEAHKIFSLMRDEYENSKRLLIFRRYQELQRIIEMFTAEPVLEKLRYLSTAEAEICHKKALGVKKNMAGVRKKSSSNTRSNATTTTGLYRLSLSSIPNSSSSSTKNNSEKVRKRRGVDRPSFSSTSPKGGSNNDGHVTMKDQPANRNTLYTTKIKDCEQVKDYRQRPTTNDNLPFPTPEEANSFCLRPNQSRAFPHDFKPTTTDAISSHRARHCKLPRNSSRNPSPRPRHEAAAFVDIATTTNSGDLTREVGATFTHGVESIKQACSKAYNFLSEKAGQISQTEVNFNSASLAPIGVSMKSVFSRAGQELRRRQRTAAKSVSLRDYYFSERNTKTHASASCSPPLHPLHRVRKTSYRQPQEVREARPITVCVQQQSITRPTTGYSQQRKTKRLTSGSGLLRTQPWGNAKNTASSTFTLPGQGISALKKAFLSTPRSSACSLGMNSSPGDLGESSLACAASQKSYLQNSHLAPSSRPNRKLSGLPAGRQLPRKCLRKSSQLSDCPDDAILDSIVLTIALDNITNMRAEYRALQGMSKLKRYKRMKAIIKSCMNVLKSESN